MQNTCKDRRINWRSERYNGIGMGHIILEIGLVLSESEWHVERLAY